MKLYRIKIDGVFYIKFIIFGENPFLQFVPTWEITEAAIYKEDKAKFYCKELNSNKECQEAGLEFTLEEVLDE